MVSSRVNLSKGLMLLPLILLSICCITMRERKVMILQRRLQLEKAEPSSMERLPTELFASVLGQHGFHFARNPSQFMLEAGFALSGNKLLYSPADLKMIQRALNTMRGFMNQGLWSGSHGSLHFIGTGSCLVKIGRPASEVAIGLLHGIYLQHWQHATVPGEHVCDQRFRLAQVLGSELEQQVWMSIGLFGNGPWNTCIKSYSKVWQHQDDFRNDSQVNDFIHELPLHVLLCDEVEEAIGGDAVLSGHWKRRDGIFFNDLSRLANMTSDDKRFGEWIESARAMSHTIHHSAPTAFYKELTPPNMTMLFGTTELNPTAHDDDIERWRVLTDTIRSEQSLIPHYLKPGGVANKAILPIIKASRTACDLLATDDMSILEYVRTFQSMKTHHLQCEKNDDRFKNQIPMPEYVPKWASQS